MSDDDRIAKIIAEGKRAQAERNSGYREQSLRIHPWICARCGREFTRQNLHLLTVHHKDHNHDNNPPDGSNWENLCVYCHDNEHRRYEEESARDPGNGRDEPRETSTYNPFAGLKDRLSPKKK